MDRRSLWMTVTLAIVAALAAAQDPAPETGVVIAGVVRDAKGSPVAKAEVTLELGRARFALTPETERWLAVDSRESRTDAEGRFRFTKIPSGAVGTVWCRTGDAFGVATGTGELVVTLGPFGAVRGAAVGKKGRLKALRIYVAGGDGFGGERGELDEAGRFQVTGLAPGAGTVYLMFNNWTVAQQPVTIKAGVAAPVAPLKAGEGYAEGADPLVEAREARLIDPRGKPVPGVQLIWSSPWMDGGMNSDAEGIVKLVGGNVAIGGPPFLLRLRHLRSEAGAFRGTLRGTSSGVATVELRPLREVAGTVTEGTAPLAMYRCLAVTVEKAPQVYWGTVEGGRYTIALPEGKAKLVFGTLAGTLHEHELTVAPGDGPLAHDVALPGK